MMTSLGVSRLEALLESAQLLHSSLDLQDLLRHRVETISKAFASAIEEAGYKNVYRGVFPIMVNQLREVVEEIVVAGAPFHVGIEACSKPDLIEALSIHSDD